MVYNEGMALNYATSPRRRRWRWWQTTLVVTAAVITLVAIAHLVAYAWPVIRRALDR